MMRRRLRECAAIANEAANAAGCLTQYDAGRHDSCERCYLSFYALVHDKNNGVSAFAGSKNVNVTAFGTEHKRYPVIPAKAGIHRE
jgi:hypothetical protein